MADMLNIPTHIEDPSYRYSFRIIKTKNRYNTGKFKNLIFSSKILLQFTKIHYRKYDI